MSQPLPVGNFRFLSKEEIAHFDVMKIPTHCDTGYIVECDLKYPPELHDLYSDYRMAPEHLTVPPDMASDFCREIKAKNWKPMQKVVHNLFDKINYVCHYRNLQFYIKHGRVLSKIHRVISFDRNPWFEPWIAYRTER